MVKISSMYLLNKRLLFLIFCSKHDNQILASCGAGWMPIDIHGYHGNARISMDILGYLWISLDFHGYRWISMDIP